MKNNINLALNFIKNHQLNDGDFLSLSSSEKNNFQKPKKYHSVFFTALILSCLNSVKKSAEIKNKAVAFILSQKSDYWSFNYWTRNSKESQTLPYPDDLDDTFCALTALYQYNPKLIDGSAMAQIVTLLTTVEKKEGGPYKTWIVPDTADKVWQDIDLVVNSNIGYFLSLQEVELESITKLINTAINQQNLTSPYYPSIYPIVYFISRFFKSTKLVDIILSQKIDDHWENPLNTALSISSLINLNVDPKILLPSIGYLIKNQQKDGSWIASAFCIDPSINHQTHYAASADLTTAFCIQALSNYSSIINIPSKKEDKTADQIHQKILQIANQQTNFLMPISPSICKKSVTLLPYLFYQSLGKNSKKISEDFLIQCGLANLYGWVAYTIYDDFIDGEGKTDLISLANFCLRQLTRIYNNILPQTDFVDLFNQTMNETDQANFWEIKNCYDPKKLPDFGDYSQLAQKSLGHALGPIAVLYALGFDKNSSVVKNTWAFFKHYLIARQLNDDTHDWEDDLKKGFINPVTVQIFKKSSHQKDFKEIFCRQVLTEMSNIILINITQAKKAVSNLKLIQHPELILNLLKTPEQSAKKAIHEQTESLKFIDKYQQL
jgi:hypothetical protein